MVFFVPSDEDPHAFSLKALMTKLQLKFGVDLSVKKQFLKDVSTPVWLAGWLVQSFVKALTCALLIPEPHESYWWDLLSLNCAVPI